MWGCWVEACLVAWGQGGGYACKNEACWGCWFLGSGGRGDVWAQNLAGNFSKKKGDGWDGGEFLGGKSNGLDRR